MSHTLLLQIAAALLLVVAYISLLRSIIVGQSKEVNGYSFLIWGSLSLCLNLLSNEPSVDVSIWRFTLIMTGFQYLVAVVSIWKRQYAKIKTWEGLSVAIAIIAMTLWYVFRERLGFYPMGFIILADICALVPTLIDLRNAEKINTDYIFSFLLFGVVATGVTFGLEQKNPQSLAYPLFEVCVNFGIMFIAIKKKISLKLVYV